jgi:ribosomal protein S13
MIFGMIIGAATVLCVFALGGRVIVQKKRLQELTDEEVEALAIAVMHEMDLRMYKRGEIQRVEYPFEDFNGKE